MRQSALILMSVFGLLLSAGADSVKPVRFGPFLLNHLTFITTPLGYSSALTNGFYHVQLGWIEPFSTNRTGIFQDTYFEIDGNVNVSPFQADIGTTFSLKPIRYLEMGLTYARQVFMGSMVTFESSTGDVPDKGLFNPPSILSTDEKEWGGSDIFIYHLNLTVDIGRVQFYAGGYRTLWDIDAKGKEFVYEYSNDVLIRSRDRTNNFILQMVLDMRPWSLGKSSSYTGFSVWGEYWGSNRTEIEKGLVAAGITGFRLGRNHEMQKRGLDVSLGYWLFHNQLPPDDVLKSLVLLADWKWNVQFLNL